MPEGHTLHRLADALTATFGGRVVRAGSPQGRFADSAAHVDGQVLVDAEAWGKQLFIAFPDERFVHVHLGLYGTFDVHDDVDEVPPPVGQVRLRLVGPRSYADLRGATTCALVTIAAGYGYRSPALVGALLSVAGIGVLFWSAAVHRRHSDASRS